MGRSENLLLVSGNAGKEPELRYTNNGTPVATFSVATSRPFKTPPSEEWQEETTWFRVTVFGPQAEKVAEKLQKGDFVRVRGRIHTFEWDVDGCPKGQHHGFEVISDRVDVLGRFERNDNGAGRRGDDYIDQLAATRPGALVPQTTPAGALPNQQAPDDDLLSDLPF